MPDLNDEKFNALRYDLVSRLADDIAHEIKNPLNAIVINLEVLKVRIARSDADAALERVAVVEHEARRLHELVDRLIQLLRPEREEASSLALDQVLDELLPLVEARARLARNEFRRDCLATVFIPVRRDVLKFALLNVLTAVHERLGEAGGTLTLECVATDDHVRMTVAAVPGGRPLQSARAGYEAALTDVAARLASHGGQLTQDDGVVTLLLPRAAPV